MNSLIKKLDQIAGVRTKGIAAVFERGSFIFLLLMILMAPHSIAATQIAGGIGLVFWIARYFVKPFPGFRSGSLAVPILALFGWTVISSVFSYAPDISMAKLPGNIIFLIFFFALNCLRTRSAVRLSAGALIFSCMINVLWMPLERVIGKGVRIEGVSELSPLFRAGFREGDGLFEANGKKLAAPEDIVEEIEKKGSADIRYYRDGHYWSWNVARSDLLNGKGALQKLGISGWSKSRSWRSSGFYGHYVTYAEVLQLIGSLAFGLLVAGAGAFYLQKQRGLREGAKGEKSETASEKQGFFAANPGRTIVILAFCLAMMSLALLLTITRAPQAGFALSAFAIVVLAGGRKMLLALVLIAIPLAIGGVIFLQQTRGVGFLDGSDGSTTWRLTVYREGFNLWTKNPRNVTLGVGMDSIKRHAVEWQLFDDGKIQIGHFHSTPLQLLVERGFPALVFWLWMFAAYLWTLFRAARSERLTNWVDRGIVLGAIGGVLGFLLSSLVHYNFGDSEVAMVLYLIMAISTALTYSNSGSIPPAVPSHPQ